MRVNTHTRKDWGFGWELKISYSFLVILQLIIISNSYINLSLLVVYYLIPNLPTQSSVLDGI